MDIDTGKIGFIGTGVMGTSMAGHLINAGYNLLVYNRTKAKAQPLIDQGAQWVDHPKAIAQEASAVITILGYPDDVESVYLHPDGLIAHAKPGSLLIDMTTSSPLLAERIAAEAKQHRVAAMDAPVSGGDSGAKNAALSIMVGAETEDFERALPLLEKMGSNIQLQGKPGSGQFTKMANQIAIAPGMLGVCEAIHFAQSAGLDAKKVLASIEKGAAGSWSLSNLAPRMIEGDFQPGFYVKHFIKDMKIALDSAQELGIDLPGLTLAKQCYERLAQQGGGDYGTQALFTLYQKQ